MESLLEDVRSFHGDEAEASKQQKMRNICAAVEILKNWSAHPDNHGLQVDALARYRQLSHQHKHAKDRNFHQQVKILSSIIALLEQTFGHSWLSDDNVVPVDWNDQYYADTAALRAVYKEAERVQHEKLSEAASQLSSLRGFKLNHILEAIKADCSDSYFYPLELNRKLALLEGFSRELDWLSDLFALHEVALGHHVSVLPALSAFRDQRKTPELVILPLGSFMRGSPDDEGELDEHPAHRVTIAERFAIGRYPVTFEQLDCFSASIYAEPCPDEGWGRGNRPAIHVSWHDANAYCDWLSGITEKSYGLLSEAQWEYAARAGTTSRYWCGDSISPADANYRDSGYGRTTPVGKYPANPWSLFDIIGNVWEWVEDCWNDSYKRLPDDGRAWTIGHCDQRVVRGGSWRSSAYHLRSANRSSNYPAFRNLNTGFRVMRKLL